MKLSTKLISGCLLSAGLAGSMWFLGAAQAGNTEDTKITRRGPRTQARAIVRGAPDSGIEGIVTFRERGGNFPEPGVNITARITGPVEQLTPGNHGIHIHEVAQCEPPFSSAGGHFDPGPYGNSLPVDENHPFHTGDIPNLRVNEQGVGRLQHRTSRITLSPGPLSVFDEDGSAIIVHANPDRGEPGVTGASGGTRIACGVIELVTDEDIAGDQEN